MDRWQKLYDMHPDGFLYLCDFIMTHRGISEVSKGEVVRAIVRDLIEPSMKRRAVPCNPATRRAIGEAL